MGTSRPIAWLSAHHAQRDVLDGLSRFDDWETLWRECPRGDWLLGIAERLGAEHAALVRAAIACARVADEAPRAPLDLCERWTRGEASAEDVARASTELERALGGAPDPATEAAMRAVLAVAMGIADRAVLPSAPAAAVESVMMASIDCGFELAMRWAHDRCAAAVRAVLTWDAIAPCVTATADRG